jgi:hypothetical protein
MTWVPLLLADPSPNLRLLVLQELLGRAPGDPEVLELAALRETDEIVQGQLSLQGKDGSFRSQDGMSDPWRAIRSTSQALLRLGYLGFGAEYAAVQRACEYLFSMQSKDGSWPLPKVKAEREFREAYTAIPLQTGIPLRGLAAAGFATDPRSEKAYEWLLEQRLPDGAWPSGKKGGFAVSALAFHPERRHSPEAKRGLDLLLAQEIQQAHTLGFEAARTIGFERSRGFFTYFARHDAGLLLDLCWRIGADLDDERVADLVAFVVRFQGEFGLWEYAQSPQASRWISFDLLRSLSRIDEVSDWVSLEPRTPFQPYPKVRERY